MAAIHIDFRDDNIGSDKIHRTTDHFQVSKLERLFLVSNFILELPSAAFDQLSSAHKPRYALFSMLLSFTILIVSLIDLVHKGRKGRVSLMNRGWIPWFYHPYPNRKPFGTFLDIIGLLCAIFQCIFASLAYVFLLLQIDNPIKVSFWPIIFAFGVLYSRLSRNPPHKSSTPKLRRLTRAVDFTLDELAAATSGFLSQNEISTGSSGIIYRAKLANGREVVIKRAERGRERRSSSQDSRSFESELEFLSRLHHKNLLGLIGYYEDENEQLLVFEYMKNGDLYQLLHDKNANEKNRSIINSWKMRIKIASDAARGIEYLHNYAVPPVIHSHISSSAILLDENWTARIADFAFSLKAPEPQLGYRSMKVSGKVGYADPEYYWRHRFTTKSDVFSFGVVLLELLTGKHAIFKDEDSGGRPMAIMDFAVPKIMSGEFVKVLDRKINPPMRSEAEAVELVAYTALHCVNTESEQRLHMTDVVANLDRSLALCRDGNNDCK